MAESFAKNLGLNAHSAGVEKTENVDEKIVKVMGELGLKVKEKPETISELLKNIENIDILVTMGCIDSCPIVPAKKHIAWNIEDPAGKEIEIYRKIRRNNFVQHTLYEVIRYVIYTIKTSESDEEEINFDLTVNKASLYIVVGLTAVILGSNLFIDGAKGLAEYFNISESIIGFSLVAFGTSLPELASSIAAAKRKLGT